MSRYTHNGGRLTIWLAAAVLALAGILLFTGSASAKVVHKWVYDGTYPAGSFEGVDAVPDDGVTPSLHDLRIDQQNDVLYGAFTPPSEFGGTPDDRLYKFNFAGNSTPFSALDPNTYISDSRANNKFAVDNTGTATQGRIYVLANGGFGGEEVVPYLPSGEPVATGNFPMDVPDFGSCGIAVAPDGNFWISFFNFGLGQFEPNGYFQEFSPSGEATGQKIYAEATDRGSSTSMCDIEIDSQGNLYNNATFSTFETGAGHGGIAKFSPVGVKHRGSLDPGEIPAAITMAVDPSTDDLFVADGWTFGGIRQYDSDGGLVGSFGQAEGTFPGISSAVGIAVDRDTHAVYVASSSCCPVHRVDKFVRTGPNTVPTAETLKAETTPTSATLRGIVNADGIDTVDCRFEWGTTISYGNTAPCVEGHVYGAATGDHEVHANLSGLTKGTEYHYRLTAKNANEIVSRGIAFAFRASSKPSVSGVTANAVDTGGALLTGDILPNGSVTHFQFEWGTEASNYTATVPADAHPPGNAQYLFNETKPKHLNEALAGLQPETTYHFRLVATNDAGTTTSEDQSFTTFAKDPPGDACPNSHVRQQTGTRLLFDCRAYELVSAANAGGYDVESDLSPGQAPLISSPAAEDRLLYSLHFGSVPGISGNPTDFGHDPYLATRGSSGWATGYVGLPADGMADLEPYGSPLLESDASLSQFAFGGSNICTPCFADGSTNIPLRSEDSIEPGMAGSLNPVGDPSQKISKVFSDDGSHFVFGSSAKFESAGDTGGSIYDRNLDTNTTQVVSTLPDGATMSGGDVGELDISSNGSRIVVGKRISTDAKGNDYWSPYMHIGTNSSSVALAPGATTGVLFDGMSSDGSRVLMTTRDKLLGADTDASADVYEALVDGAGTLSLRLVSTKGGSPSNDDSCNPPGLPNSWNTVTGAGKCDAVAYAGGAGVADDGTLYFLSPEQLDGAEGLPDQPNLYVAAPGAAPEFVATIDTSIGKPPPAPPLHPVENAAFGGALSTPKSLTVDQSNGDVYVITTGDSKVQRFTAAGAPKNFTAGPGTGTNAIPGLEWPFLGAAQVAVDSSAGPSSGNIYVVSQNEFFESSLSVFAPTGALLTTLTGSGTFAGAFGFACGVTVDNSNGNVYVGDYFGNVWRYSPAGATVVEADYSGGIAAGFGSCKVAAAAGKVWVAGQEDESLTRYEASAFALGAPPAAAGKAVATGVRSVATDNATGNAYAAQTNKVSVYDDDAEATLLESFGTGSITNSQAVAVRSSNLHVFAGSNTNSIVELGFEIPPYTPIDNPAVVHGVQQSAVHSYGDFQVTPDGGFAAFSTNQALTGYPGAGHSMLYRYDAENEAIECVSCPATGINATADTVLPPYGLGLTNDGRVFFTTADQLVLRDTNAKKDAYEWKDGKQQLISNGVGPLPSSFLTVTPDGTDAFFFTNEVLADEDDNGNAVKVYDARTDGGFPFVPARVPCAASDECHGPGTLQPPPPNINTVTGSGPPRGVKSTNCRKGFVKRKGRCVKKHPKPHRKRHTRGTHNG